MDAADLAYAGVVRQAELIRKSKVSSVELTQALLDRIGRLNGQLNAFRVVMEEEALAEAYERDQTRARDERAPLLGVPIAIKDEIDVAGQVTTFGGAANVNPASADSEVVRRLRAAGAVIIGKTRMTEFGAWPFGESSAGGYVRNPWDPERTSGGSSAGTAAAVASGMVGAGLGGDGGGSIRVPSACCNLFGLKCQRGRVPITPPEHRWAALGVWGPLARTVADSALVYDVIGGPAPGERFVAEEPRMPFLEAARTEPQPLRIAFSARSAVRGMRLDREQAAALEATAALLEELGHEVREVDSAYPDATLAFVPQFLGGVREEAATVDRPELLERRTKQVLATARLLPSSATEWAIGHSERLALRVNRTFDDHDVLLTPTIASLPRPIGVLDGVSMIGASLRSLPYVAYAALWNVCGNPAASVPAGFSEAGLPLATQLVGRPHDEVTILQVAAQLERARPWADRIPPIG